MRSIIYGNNTNTSGFTLIELAMVLFIIGLVLGGVLVPLSVSVEKEERTTTREQLKNIKSNLIGYTLANGHLPCPDCPDGSVGNCGTIQANDADDINDGVEDGLDTGGNASARPYDACATVEGNLPWATLGVDQFDAWDNRYTYRVSDNFADNYHDGEERPVTFTIDSTGNINVIDEDGNMIADELPALVISYGKNNDNPGNPDSASELENQNGDPVFVNKDYTADEGADEFDDMMIWITSSALVYRLVQAERLP